MTICLFKEKKIIVTACKITALCPKTLGEIGSGRGLIHEHKIGQFSSGLLQGRKFNYFGFKVLFDNEPVLLRKNTKYCLGVKITGPDSTCGDNGDSTVTCSGVTFTFLKIRNDNETTTQRGQFAEILFSL